MKKKAQIISLDLVLAIMVFIIILVIFIAVFLYGRLTQKVETYEYELDYLYRNLEMNLKQGPETEQFLVKSRVYKDKLSEFVTNHQYDSIDKYVIGYVSGANGIGLDPEAYDVCMYFTDNNNNHLELGNVRYLGKIRQKTGNSYVVKTCQEVIGNQGNPCDDYKDSISLFKPVLLDEGTYEQNRIIQMNLVVCKI